MQPEVTSFAVPQISFTSAPAVEVRDLGNGEEISQKQALKEVEALNEQADPAFVWRLETAAELFALRDLTHKNQHGAYSRDESLKRDWYWTADEHPAFEGARVVVGFGNGNVSYNDVDGRCIARAVRVARQ